MAQTFSAKVETKVAVIKAMINESLIQFKFKFKFVTRVLRLDYTRAVIVLNS